MIDASAAQDFAIASATEEDLEEFKIGRLELGPDDILVFKTSKSLTMQAAEHITRAVRSVFGDGRKVMILDGGLEIAVLTAAELQARIS
jgi:hypothetical protein